MNVLEPVGTFLLVVGAGLMALAAAGLHRFGDPAVRLHVAAKASSAGVLLALVGVGLRSGEVGVATELVLTGVFLVLTVPIATHGLARAILRDDDPGAEIPVEPLADTPVERPDDG